MLGFETIDSAAEESINKLKDVLNGMIKYAEVEELTDEMLNTIKQWTKNIIGRTEKNDKLRNIIVKEKKYDFSNG